MRRDIDRLLLGRGDSKRLGLIIAGLGLLVPASIGFVSDTPTRVSPLPALTFWPTLFFPKAMVVFLAGFLFVIWLRGTRTIPLRSYVLLLVTAPLNFVYLADGWRLGVQYQGLQYTHAVCLISGAWTAFLVLALVLAWKVRRTRNSLFLHWMLFAWLVWFAFPYLGELP